MQQMITEQQRTTAAILALAEAIKAMPPPVVQVVNSGLENAAGNSGKEFSSLKIEPEAVKAALPSKMELAAEWLRQHPEDIPLTGRELKELRKPHGVEISHKTWNDAKKLV